MYYMIMISLSYKKFMNKESFKKLKNLLGEVIWNNIVNYNNNDYDEKINNF